MSIRLASQPASAVGEHNDAHLSMFNCFDGKSGIFDQAPVNPQGAFKLTAFQSDGRKQPLFSICVEVVVEGSQSYVPRSRSEQCLGQTSSPFLVELE